MNNPLLAETSSGNGHVSLSGKCSILTNNNYNGCLRFVIITILFFQQL